MPPSTDIPTPQRSDGLTHPTHGLATRQRGLRFLQPSGWIRRLTSGLAVLLILLGSANAMAATPTTTGLSPSSTMAPGAAFTLTVNGANFVNGSTVQWNNTNKITTYVSDTQLTASILATDVATAGSFAVTVMNPTDGGSNTQDFWVNNPVPTITSISPTSIAGSGPAFTLTINGTNFVSASMAKWNGAFRTATYVSPTQITTLISAADIASMGTVTVNAFNNLPDGGTSADQTFTITVPLPPTITSLSPASTMAPGAAFTLVVNGTYFINGSTTVQWNGSARTTTYVNSAQVTASIPATDVTTAGTATVTVTTTSGTSNGQTFTITNPVPTITSLSPSSTLAPGAAFTLTVNGTGFSSSNASTVNWNGSARPTTYVSPTQVTASIPATDVTTAGTATVTVTTTSGTSNGQTFTITNPVPTITSLSPSSTMAPGAAFTLTVNGTGFSSSNASTVNWNGSARPTTYVSPTQVTASIPATDVASGGTATVTVTTTSGTSNGQTFTITNPAPTLSSVSPNSILAGSGNLTVTATGTNFVTGSTVQWNGTPLATTYVSNTQLTAVIPASDLTTGGTATITVVNATPGGGTSAGQTFTITNPVPTITSLSPPSINPGVSSLTLTVNGTNFVNGSTIQWNGSARTTTYVSTTQVITSIPATDVASGGTATVTVVNSAPGGGLSNAQTFTINYPVPALSNVSPNSIPMGSGDLTITATGDNFYTGASTVQWNGTPLATTYVSSTRLTAVIPAQNLTGPETVTLTVLTGSPGGGASSAKPFTVIPTFTIGPLTQDGWNVTATVTWPTASTITNQVIDCGTATTQTITTPAGTCVYTKAGTFTVTGTSTVSGTPSVKSPSQTITVLPLVPTQVTLTPTIDGRLAVPGTDTYALPVPLSVAIALTQPAGIGTADPLDLNISLVTVQRGAGTSINARITSADPLTYTASLSLVDVGTYTITLQGHTVSGAAISASTTTTLTLTSVSFQVGSLTQNSDHFNVDVPIRWSAGAVPVNVDCGTVTTQTFTGPSGTCTYGQSGPSTVSGRYIEPYHGATLQTTASVSIPLLTPTTATLAATVNGLQPASDGTIAPFHFPALASTAITLTRPDGIGIVDPLDLSASHLVITPAGGPSSNVFVRAGADVLHNTAAGQLNAPATATLQLNGQTVSGGAVSGSLTLIVGQGSPVLTLGDLVQDGFTMLMTVSWPTDLQGATPISLDCGTPNTQVLTGPTGACRYTTAGPFQVRGSYTSPETGAPTLYTIPQPVTIPSRVSTGADLTFTVNTIPVSGSSIAAYRFPAIVKSTITLRPPDQIGIIDPLDVGSSRLMIGPTGGTTTAYRLSLGTDQTLTTTLSAFDTPGNYTISLNGQTVGGHTITATHTLTVTAANFSLVLGPLVQDGANVDVSVTWPDGVTPVGVDCGTSSLQTFTSPAGVCSYTRPGTFQITGTFLSPEDNTHVTALPATVTIPALAPVNPQIALQVNGQPATTSASTYRLPSNLTATITLTQPDGIGILDQIDTQNSFLAVTPDGLPSTRYRLIVRDNPLSAIVNGEVRRIGAYAITLQGKTLTGQTLSASATLTIDIASLTLLANPPAQDGDAVTVWVKWPDNGPVGTIHCGFMGQTLTAPSGTCRYTRAGSYQILGLFLDSARGSTVLTDPIPVIIPLLAPTNASLSIVSVNSAGVSSDTSGSIPLYTTLQPQSYPVGVRLKIAFTKPDGIGILDVIDRNHSSLTATAVADGATPIPMGMSFGSAPSELTALASLRSFSPDPADATHWRYQFIFTGHSLGGTAYSAHADLTGTIGGPSPIALQVSRSAPSILYAPATYRYSLTGARSATLGEPFTATWTVTPNGQPPGQTVQNNYMTVTFEGPGTYQVQLDVRGPFSGDATWFDTVTIPVLPAADAPTIAITTPDQNRPPAAYRFRVVAPRLADPRERIGVPTWTVEGATVSTPALVTTFMAAGPHQIDVTVPTSYGRTLEAHTTVTVNSNQPPVGTVDCSRSSYRQLTKQYDLYCRATAADPDGRISTLVWVIPELQITRPDTTVLALERDQPMAITVELHITDNSGDETVVTVPIDMATLPVQ